MAAWWKAVEHNSAHAIAADRMDEGDDPLAHVFRHGTVGKGILHPSARMFYRGPGYALFHHRDESGGHVVSVVRDPGSLRVQSVRLVGSKGGYPYSAVGTYKSTPRANGDGHYWRLVSSGRWRRTTNPARHLLDENIRYQHGVRHGHDAPHPDTRWYEPGALAVSAKVPRDVLKRILREYPRNERPPLLTDDLGHVAVHRHPDVQAARGDVFLRPSKPEDDLPDPDSKPSETYPPATPAKVIRRTVAPVWRLAKNGGHLVGLPQKDGTTLVHRFDTLGQARSVVFDWWKGASPEHRKGLVEQMKSLPKPGTPKITLGPKPIPKAGPPLPVQAAKPLPTANRVVTAQPKKAPAWLGKPPVRQPDAYTQSVEYKPGMQPPTKLNRKESSGSIGTAVNELLSNRQRVRRAIAQKIAQEAGLTVLGMSDAASLLPRPRASVVQQIGHDDYDTATYAAAWYGMLAREPRLTVFHEGQGNDFLHVTKSPLSVSQILDAAAKAGLPGVTVSPDGVVHSYNPGGNLSRKIVGFHKMIRASRPETIKGTGHQIGARTGTESQARREYREIIKKFQGA
jgi:hypothetical protein